MSDPTSPETPVALSGLAGTMLVCPPMGNVDARLHEALIEADGLRREVLAMQRWAAQELGAFVSGPATPEGMAYLGFAAAAFQQLDAAAHLLDTHLTLAAELLVRSAFEAFVQMQVIMQPVDAPAARAPRGGAGERADAAPVEGWDLVRERLRAHTAYCLLRDDDFYQRHVLVHLAALHTPVSPTRPPAAVDRLVAEGILPEPSIVSEQEAAHEARMTADTFGTLRDRNRRWLTDERLVPLVERYGRLSQSRPGAQNAARQTSPSWFAMVMDQQRATIGTALGQLDIPVLYGAFAKSSAILHRNTFEGALAMTGDGAKIVPLIAGSADATDETCRGIQRYCAYVVTALPRIRRHVLETGPTSGSPEDHTPER